MGSLPLVCIHLPIIACGILGVCFDGRRLFCRICVLLDSFAGVRRLPLMSLFKPRLVVPSPERHPKPLVPEDNCCGHNRRRTSGVRRTTFIAASQVKHQNDQDERPHCCAFLFQRALFALRACSFETRLTPGWIANYS